MPSPKSVITSKVDQCDTLACENTILMHARRFDEKAAQEQASKIVKMHGGSTSMKSPAPNPSTNNSLRSPPSKKGPYGTSTSNQQPANQSVDLKKKEAIDKDVPADLNNSEKKSRVSTGLDIK
jgi:hypothetical protein